MRPLTHRISLSLLGLLLLAAALATGTFEQDASGATAAPKNLQVIKFTNDKFWNYDFNSERISASNVDWAVDMVFTNAASVNKVKARVGYGQIGVGAYPFGASKTAAAQYARLLDYPDPGKHGEQSGAAVWDSDHGGKSAACTGNHPLPHEDLHFRVYADGDDAIYQPQLGYVVIGTTHHDYYECFSKKKHFGNSEDAELQFNKHWRDGTKFPILTKAPPKWRYFPDKFNLHNYEPRRVAGDHVWDNDGLATVYEAK